MSLKKYTADRIFTGTQFLEDQVLVVKEDGTIEAILSSKEAGEDVRKLKGILTPGLVNCHCHLELSHLKDVIPPHTGLIDFLCSVVTKRGFPPNQIQERILAAEREMYDNGIVAVGDIGNTADTAEVKCQSQIRWQNFVEVLSFTDEKAVENMNHFKVQHAVLEEAMKQSKVPSRTTLVPHAPYSISPATFRLINEATAGQIISLHNQEHSAENELYRAGGGDFLRFFPIFGMNQSPFPITGRSSLQSVLPYFNQGQTIFLIHNTCISEEDILWANEYAAKTGLKLFYCLCVNANLYIENKVPPIDLLIKHQCSIVLGTDSYSSNWQLSIAKEVAVIRAHFPHIPLETVLGWATQTGAAALHWNDSLGSISPGKKPGLVLFHEKEGRSERIQ